MAKGSLFQVRMSSIGVVCVAALCGIVLTACAGMQQTRTGSDAPPPEAQLSCPSGMVLIPAGAYQMGSNAGNDDEKPPHQVSVAAFCMDRTEVTVAAYTACVREGKCARAPTTADWPGIAEEDKALDSEFCNGSREDRQQHPINCVDWTMATAFCRAQGNRLPTEEEWEYAARGEDGRTYPWGNAEPAPDLLNTCDLECVAMGERHGRPGWPSMFDGSDGWESTAPVGSYPKGASPFGVLDMAGNLWEMTSSGYSTDYSSPRSDEIHVYRGGGWGYHDPFRIRTAYRGKSGTTYRGADVGFRCAKTP